MAISPQTVEEVQRVVNVYDVISDYIQLKKSGMNYVALCPFHNEKTPSFVVSPTKNIFKCFGCGISGDAVKFVMEYEKLSFFEAILKLANRYGIKVEYIGKDRELERKPLYEAMSKVKDFYFESLLHNQDGKNYLTERNLSPSVIKHFEIGYAPKEINRLLEFCEKNNVDIGHLEQVGLIYKNSEGRYVDKFASRIVFPIRDIKGNVVAFGGRAIQSHIIPKYLNSPESKIYNKSKILYGLYTNLEFIKEKGEVVIVEGYIDMISMWQIGVKNVVATLGTAFTQGHADLLKRFVKTAYLMFDSDEAGKKASIQAAKILLNVGIIPKYVMFENYKDPDELAKAGIKIVKEHLAKSEDFIVFIIERIKQTKNIESKQDRLIGYQKLYQMLMDLLRSISSPELRYSYIKLISDELDIPPSKIENDLEVNKTSVIENKKSKDGSFISKLNTNEKAVLKLAFDKPYLLKNCDFCDRIKISPTLKYYFEIVMFGSEDEYEEIKRDIESINISIPEEEFYNTLITIHKKNLLDEEERFYSILPDEEKERMISEKVRRKSKKEVVIDDIKSL